MKKKLELKKITIRDLDESTMKTMAGGNLSVTAGTVCVCPTDTAGCGSTGCASVSFCTSAKC